MRQKIQIILGAISVIIVVIIILIALIYPIYSGIKWWFYKAKNATGEIDVPSLNSARGYCDAMYHIEKIPYNALPEWCQEMKIKYKNYKPVGIIPQ